MRHLALIAAIVATLSLPSCLTFNWQSSVQQVLSNACNSTGDCGSDGPSRDFNWQTDFDKVCLPSHNLSEKEI
ncbi:hypothetical protein [Thalassospira xiamenensis]|uniref:hypothetical protein n=1 Tax=Thalassospira xiamenensis TaxID=220697 RepID=UPI003AA9D92D